MEGNLEHKSCHHLYSVKFSSTAYTIFHGPTLRSFHNKTGLHFPLQNEIQTSLELNAFDCSTRFVKERFLRLMVV